MHRLAGWGNQAYLFDAHSASASTLRRFSYATQVAGFADHT
jgi:serine protease inhibitor ecotin